MMKIKNETKVTEEIIERNHLRDEILDLTIDTAFKKVLSDERNKYYIAYLIWYCTGIDKDYVEKHIKYKNNFVSSKNISKKTGNLDIVVEVDDSVINIEMNKEVTEMLIRKNKHYVSLLNGENTSKIINNRFSSKYIIQINISTKARIPNTDELLYEIEYMEKNLNIKDVYNNEIIYDINLDYLKKHLYNKGKISQKEKGLLMFIERNEKKLEDLYRGDKKMKEVLDNTKGVNYIHDDMFIMEYDRDAFKEQVEKEYREDIRKEAREEGLAEGRAEGLEQGKKQNSIEIAKNALKMNISLEDIAKLTGLSIEELNSLKKI